MLLNDSTLFETVQSITGCDPIGSCYPVVFRLDPGTGGDSWHDDVDGNRLVGLTVNIGGRYDGGVLQLRDRRTGHLLGAVANTGPGDAVMFRIARGVEHCVTPVTGMLPRLTMAGWFQREPKATRDWPRRLAL